jgi:glycosyltransferase involved in cell wall biosynthesis
MTCRVTVGIPFFNAGRTLADAVRSVFAQTLADWELLLVDDGSSDGSLGVARRVRDNRVRVIADGVNRGLSARLNQIAALARGDYLARMDADDLMHPERLERQVRFLAAHPDVDLLGSTVCTIDHANNPLGVRMEQPLDVRPAAVLRRGLYVHPEVTGRTRWFRQNPYDPAFVRAEDYELWCRVCRSATFRKLPEPLLFYREAVPINLGNYLLSGKTTRRAIRRFGPAIVGRRQTALLVAGSHLRCLAYRIGTRLGLQGWLLGKRNRPLTPAEAAAARAVIGRVLQTPVLGLFGSREPAESGV